MITRLNLILTTLLVLCALSVINAQYQARRLFIELERAQAGARQHEIEWAQLQLDQSTLAKHARIEEQALRSLNMVSVHAGQIQYITVGDK